MSGYEAFAGYYDRLTDNVDYEKRAAYFYGILREHGGGGGILLDLACGTGSMSVLMAGYGYDVIGVDASGDDIHDMAEKAIFFGRRKLGSFKKLGYDEVKAILCSANG